MSEVIKDEKILATLKEIKSFLLKEIRTSQDIVVSDLTSNLQLYQSILLNILNELFTLKNDFLESRELLKKMLASLEELKKI